MNFLPLFAAKELKVSQVVRDSGLQNSQYIYESKKNWQDHISLDQHLYIDRFFF